MKTPEEKQRLADHFGVPNDTMTEFLTWHEGETYGLRREFINFLTHIQAYPVQLTPGLRAEIENYKTKLSQ